MTNVYIDFETRSEVDLKKVGIWEYSKHPSTEVLCIAYKLGDAETKVSTPDDLILPPHLTYWAHNALFEYCLWLNCGCVKYDWPKPDLEQWHCTAAQAAYHSLPRSLDGACSALELPVQKDMGGHKLMLKMCKPRRPTKTNDAKWHESEADLNRLAKYCAQDVEAEYALAHALDPLPESERELWLLTQRLNLRGVGVDAETVQAGIEISRKIEKSANKQIHYYTDGAVQTCGQVARIGEWCAEQGHSLNDCSAATIAEALADPDLDPTVQQVLQLRQTASKSSLKKLQAISDRAGTDARVRDLLLYYGAGTGRWAGMGVQPQNLPRCSFNPDDLEHIHRLVQQQDTDAIELLYGPVTSVLSQALRSTLCAAPGHVLIGADYSSIEARVLLWLARDPGLKVFKTGDIYKDMAAAIFGKPVELVTKSERQLGKIAILGLGYGMGSKRFYETCAAWGVPITEGMAQTVVETYRTKYEAVVNSWHSIERDIKAALAGRNRLNKDVQLENDFLTIELPSGRKLYYYKPKLVLGETPWGDPVDKITYMSVDGYSRKWVRTETWGGKLVENITQAVARDIMAEAMSSLSTQWVDIVLSIHDEIVIEAPLDKVEGKKTVLKKAMLTAPDWADGLPLAIDEPWVNRRYVK
jgi:DNA polymerase